MAEVKWIKIDTDVFNNRKIKQIKKMPEGKSIIVIWFHILCLAGKINDGGFVYFTKDIPFTDEMLAVEFDEDLKIIRLALETFRQFRMLEIVEDFLLVSNWEKYQSADKLKKIREKTRLRVAKHREKQKQIAMEKDSNVTVTLRNAIDKDKDKEESKTKNREDKSSMSVETDSAVIKTPIINFEKIKNYWNEKSKLKEITAITEKRKGHLNARIKEHGIDAIYKVVDNIANSSFLRGENNRGWMANFDWVFRPNNFVKVLEGNYLDEEKPKEKYDFYNIRNGVANEKGERYPSHGIIYPNEK